MTGGIAVPTALASGALVVGAAYAQKKTPTIQHAIGVGGIAILLAAMEAIDYTLARSFAALILLAVCIAHLPPIFATLERLGR